MRKHVVFVVDASRSMDKCDVIDKGTNKRRIEAVLDACFEFIKDQLQSGGSSAKDHYSMVSFNDVAKVQLRRERMGGRNLFALRKELEAKIKPTNGTSYAAGLTKAWNVASGGVNDAEQFVLIFLSDGRPGDMSPSCKREQAPAFWLRTMRERFRGRLTFHGVGIGPENFQLLKKLCTVAQGTFHKASLVSVMRGGRNALSNTFREISSSVSSVCSSSRTEKCFVLEDVEEGKWDSTTVDQYLGDKLALEGGHLAVQMRDLQVLVRKKPFAQGGMRYCFRVRGLGPCGQRSKKDRATLVGKQSKFYLSVSEQLEGFVHVLQCHALARQQAVLFNHELKSFRTSPAVSDLTYAPLRSSFEGLKISSCDVYRLKDDQEPGGCRYLLVEPFLEGKYVKYNGNNGYVADQARLDQDQLRWWHVAQAFSHFTHHRSGGAFLVCDMQGVDRSITDPAVHSLLRKYGDGDRGTRGIRDFLDSHECNAICRHLHLPPLGEDRSSGKSQTRTAARSSAPQYPTQGFRGLTGLVRHEEYYVGKLQTRTAARSSAAQPPTKVFASLSTLSHEVIYEEAEEEAHSDNVVGCQRCVIF